MANFNLMNGFSNIVFLCKSTFLVHVLSYTCGEIWRLTFQNYELVISYMYSVKKYCFCFVAHCNLMNSYSKRDFPCGKYILDTCIIVTTLPKLATFLPYRKKFTFFKRISYLFHTYIQLKNTSPALWHILI